MSYLCLLQIKLYSLLIYSKGTGGDLWFLNRTPLAPEVLALPALSIYNKIKGQIVFPKQAISDFVFLFMVQLNLALHAIEASCLRQPNIKFYFLDYKIKGAVVLFKQGTCNSHSHISFFLIHCKLKRVALRFFSGTLYGDQSLDFTFSFYIVRWWCFALISGQNSGCFFYLI